MSVLAFSVLRAHPEPYAASPALTLRTRIEETSGTPIYAIALRAQVRIDPQRRRYDATESEGLLDLFGAPERYGDTLRPLLWTHVAQTVVAFEGATEIDLPIPCSYDFEVAAHKYVAALAGGDIPLTLLFSGTIFARGEAGIAAELVPWTCEATFRLPVATWRAAMDAVFPGTAWLRIDRDTFDELSRYKAARALPTWDAAMTALLEAAKAAP